MKFHFYLRPSKGIPKQAITLVCYFKVNGKKTKFAASTGFLVAPNHWNAKDERVKNMVAATNSQSINNVLNALKSFLEKRHLDVAATGELFTSEKIRAAFDEFRNPQKPVTFVGFIEQHIEDSKTKNNVGTHQKLSKNTIEIYKKTLAYLVEFGKKYPIDFKDLDLKFYERLTLFFEGKNMMPNTIGKYMKTLKSFIRAADESGIEVVQDYKRRAFTVPKEDVSNVYLNEYELQKLFDLDLSNSSALANVRDIFLVGCQTGLRFSDYQNIKTQNIKTETDATTGETYQVVKVETKKTGASVAIPISEMLQNIIDAHGGGFPKGISNQKTNEHLKKISQLAGFTGNVEISETRGGKRSQSTRQKWELITTHTARRSFATNQYLRGIPSITIMQITGHKSEKAFIKYIKVTQSEHVQIMLKNWNTKPESVLKAVV